MLTGTAESVNTYRYLSFLGSRWRFIAASCAIAMSLALGVSLTRPKLYTATCRILIEPPAGTDIRSALGVSPIYLESLKTYRYLSFLGSRWRFIAASCAIAMSLALGVSLTRPKLYTATCRILIEPPAGTDIRSALGVSPI